MTRSRARTLILDVETGRRTRLLRLFRSLGAPCVGALPTEAPALLPKADVVVLVYDSRDRATSRQVLLRLHRDQPGTRCVVLAANPDHRLTRAAFRDGAHDVLPFDEESRVLVDAVEAALRDADAERERRRFVESEARRLRQLTPRERTVLWPMVRGTKTKEIAHALALKEKTVESHRGNILRKTGCGCLAELVLLVTRVHGDDSIDARSDGDSRRDGFDGRDGGGERDDDDDAAPGRGSPRPRRVPESAPLRPAADQDRRVGAG